MGKWVGRMPDGPIYVKAPPIPPLTPPEVKLLFEWADKHRLASRAASFTWRLVREYRACLDDNQRLRDLVAELTKGRHKFFNYLYSPAQVAEYLRVSHQTVVEWCKEGSLKARKVGFRWRILERDLEDFLKRSPRHAARTATPTTESASETEETSQTLPPRQDSENSR